MTDTTHGDVERTCDLCGAPVSQNCHGEIWHKTSARVQELERERDEALAGRAAALDAIKDLRDEPSVGNPAFDAGWNAALEEAAAAIRGDDDA